MALFTKENAAEMARRSALARETLKARAADPTNEPHEADEFRRMRLSRVRAQLNALDKAMADELAKDKLDASKLDRLASAAIRLNEQERQLSNRSLPPTLKANAVAARARRSVPDPQPEPE